MGEVSEDEAFQVEIKVRHYELDTLGHLNHAVYHSYAEIARLELMEQASGPETDLRGERVAPVLLASQISFRRELGAGDVVLVSCEAKFASSKTFGMDSVITKQDGTVAAEITCTLGLMDLDRRRLVEDPQGCLQRAGVDLDALTGAGEVPSG